MVIDELVVRLILDTTGFKQGQKDAAAASEQMAASLVASAGKGEKAQTDAAGRIVKALERIADQGDKLASEQEDQHKRVAEATNKTSVSVEGLARKFLGLYALVTAGRGLREFVSELTTADSALGRTARNIDMGVKSLSTFQLAAEASGGSAAGITGTMQSLSAELQRAALTGSTPDADTQKRMDDFYKSHPDLMRVAAFHHSLSRTVNNTDRSSRTKIGSIAIQTQATDAQGIAADLDKHLARSREVTQLNSGLA